jgi:hypothetical protein
MTAPKATIMPTATTVTTVKDNAKAPSKLPKTRPPLVNCRTRKANGQPICNLPALTLVAVSN